MTNNEYEFIDACKRLRSAIWQVQSREKPYFWEDAEDELESFIQAFDRWESDE